MTKNSVAHEDIATPLRMPTKANSAMDRERIVKIPLTRNSIVFPVLTVHNTYLPYLSIRSFV